MPKEQAFTSHVFEERQVALALRKYIRQAFGEQQERIMWTELLAND